MAKLSRRTVLGGAAAAARVAAAAFGGYELLRKPGAASGGQPNILVVMVDQMRAPQWFPDAAQLGALLPNLDGLRARSTSFGSHYSASNMCTPSRGVLTTGLYSHQTGCLYTGEGPCESTLAPRFPTWGTMLRDAGYRTWWWGKWHLGRTQLTSSADLAPLLLTIAHGGASWRSDSRYTYLASRADIAGIAADANAPGRPWIAHATDDMSVEEMAALLKSPLAQKVFGAAGPPTNIPTSAPSHIVAVRTPDAKLGMYTYWKPDSMAIDTSRPIHHELYDYASPSGVQELDNQAGHSPKQDALQALLDHEVLPELQAPLPDFLDDAQQQGLANMEELATLREG